MAKTKRRRATPKATEGTTEATPSRDVINEDNWSERQRDRMNEIRTGADSFTNSILANLPAELANELRHEVNDVVVEIQEHINEEEGTRKPAAVEREPVESER